MSAPDITIPVRDALLAAVAVTSLLPAYLGSYPVFTRRPVPADTPYPCLLVSQDIVLNDRDGINDYRPFILRDIAVYHTNEAAANYRLTMQIALAVWRTFNERRYSITVPDWDVVDVTALAPVSFDVEASKIAGRVVQLQVLVARNY